MSNKKIAFTIADNNNIKYAENMVKSLRKFHGKDEIDVKIYREDDIAKYKDPNFFYRATPIIAQELIKDYEMVLKLDADQLITGSLDYIINSEGWDVGTVYNWNPTDPKTYGVVTVATIDPIMYFNCGLVAMRSKAFIDHWKFLCFTEHFDKMRYREQDLLNVMCHYGNYKVRSFDDPDKTNQYAAWHGLRSKGEWIKIVVKDGELVLPADTETGYPHVDTKIKVLHWAGGNEPIKQNYRIGFNEEVIEYLDNLLK